MLTTRIGQRSCVVVCCGPRFVFCTGFYYVALDRRTGALRGLYYDPSSSPFQELSLQVEHSSGAASNSSSSRRSSASSAGAANGDCRMSSSSGGSSTGSIDSSGVSFGTFSFA